MGPAAAPLYDLVTAELRCPCRHTAGGGPYGDRDIPDDEELLRMCRDMAAGS
ncbi:hypothetical protein [Streptomyces capoamus]